jgi:hypothetical protein
VKWLWIFSAAGVLVAVTIDALRHWKYITSIPPKRTSGLPQRVTLEVGIKFGRNSISASFFVPIAIARSMPSCSFPP